MTRPRGVGRGTRPKFPPALLRELHAQRVTVQQIARLTGLAPATVYYHIGRYYRGYKRRAPAVAEPDPHVQLYRAEKARREGRAA
jgi:DNA-binding transcriptional ArsR family regulator